MRDVDYTWILLSDTNSVCESPIDHCILSNTLCTCIIKIFCCIWLAFQTIFTNEIGMFKMVSLSKLQSRRQSAMTSLLPLFHSSWSHCGTFNQARLACGLHIRSILALAARRRLNFRGPDVQDLYMGGFVCIYTVTVMLHISIWVHGLSIVYVKDITGLPQMISQEVHLKLRFNIYTLFHQILWDPASQ